jgi:hypothetical protein
VLFVSLGVLMFGWVSSGKRLVCETGVSDFGSDQSKYVPTEYCCVLNSVQLYTIQRYGNGEGVTSIYDITNCTGVSIIFSDFFFWFTDFYI